MNIAKFLSTNFFIEHCSLNRHSFLHNISYLCPSLAIFVKNCYSTLSKLFFVGGTEKASKEGTTQGDPVSLAICGIRVTNFNQYGRVF